MKRLYIIYAIAFGCLCMTACVNHEDGLQDRAAEEISLSAVVDDVEIMSRASDSSIMHAAVWFSLTSGNYPSEVPEEEKTPDMKESNVPVHSTVDFQSGAAAYPDSDNEITKPRYPTSRKPVYCVGFCPVGGWSHDGDDVQTARHEINGYDDLMFAPEISGSWERHFEFQHYRHLLTWLKIAVCTTTAEADKYWGKLKKITLNSVPESLTIDLTKPESDSFSLQSAVTYSQTKRSLLILNRNDEDDDDKNDPIKMGITMQEVASVYCHPSPHYELVIECEHATTKPVTINLQALDGSTITYPAGLQYVVMLYFHPFNVVEGVCTLNAWNAQNEDLYPN